MTAGTFGGGTFGWPWGGGVGAYIDNHGRLYPQVYAGTPRWGLSAGSTPDLEGLLTGPSVSGSIGFGPVRANVATSGGANGVGFGTPGAGVTYGFGPYELSDDYSQPWKRPLIRDSAAAAGIPSRSNVWEYDYPDTGSGPAASAGDSGAAVRFRSLHEHGNPQAPAGGAAIWPGASGGLLGRIIALTGNGVDSADWQAPPIAVPSSGNVFSEGAPPVRFLQRVSGSSWPRADGSDLRYLELPQNGLADLPQSYVRTNYPYK